MRALLDANIFISYLLTPNRESPIVQIVNAGIRGKYTLLLSAELLEEFSYRALSKPYLRERISQDELKDLARILFSVSEIIPEIKSRIPAVMRDPKDDYLLAYAIVGQADFLVSGDQDLLVLKKVKNCQVLTPRDFHEVLSTD